MIKPVVAQNHPWVIVRTVTITQFHTVAHFANRQDAENHLRFLRRTIPNGGFEIMFELPEDAKENLNIELLTINRKRV
ncbi:hypothetical protein QHH11_28245 [Aphanizomenon sp. PH219]|uniref:Uncharacterized protein n=1 Tax=Dolichospermum heterosporum TAC447 TaxID=747523 RepID=A0ABY5LU58_9CYAN|nr:MULTISPECIES: hypothetical protein [Aphanizomenonaceae]MDK2412834.1 hypothetical protein [Aphanizomenon sp. 202]MDK2462957.1 hypothetical protein [Aphanizomenon sp. PH219]UUO14083.1 hypothetical protein NG743_18805 [Dolichospermum heterosporum TAC447]